MKEPQQLRRQILSILQTEQHRRQQKLAADMAASHAAHQREQAQQGEVAPPAQLPGPVPQVRPQREPASHVQRQCRDENPNGRMSAASHSTSGGRCSVFR